MTSDLLEVRELLIFYESDSSGQVEEAYQKFEESEDHIKA